MSRRLSHWSRWVGILLGIISLAETAAAEPDPERARRAHAAFSEGVRAFESKDYDAALKAFRRANTIFPDERVQLPIANTLEQLGRLLDARTAYLRALATPDLAADQADKARAGLERVESALSQLSITTNASAARVELDGVERCELPCDPLWLKPGTHQLALRHAHGVERRAITLERGATELHIPTVPPPVDAVHTFPSWLGWTGTGLAVLGTAGAIGFGLRTEALRDEYVAQQDPSLRDEAIVSRGLTNASIGIGVTGAAAVVADLIWALVDDEADPGPSNEAALLWRF